MYYFGNGLNPVWPLVWLAPLPVLWLALRQPWQTAALSAVAAIALGGLNLWSYFTTTLGSPAAVWVLNFVSGGVVFAAGVLVYRRLVLKGAVWSGLFAVPAFWVAAEYLRNVATPHGSAGSLAYSQLQFLPFLQLASVTGPWGMTFVLLLVPAAVAVSLHVRHSCVRRSLYVATAGLGTLAAVLAYGTVRLWTSPTQPQSAKVGLIASDGKPEAPVAEPGEPAERLFRAYAAAAEKLAAGGAEAILLPEKVGVTIEGRSEGMDVPLQALSARTGATIVAGVVHVDGPVKYNEARIYVPNETDVQRYDKQHMLPPFESNLRPGTSLVMLSRAQQRWGIAICKDMDFAFPARQYGQDGAGLMLVPAWDFVVDAGWHGHMAVMRGVENGFSVARAARTGFLTVSDDRGRILAEVSSSSAPFATLLADVPANHSWTVYQWLGDWFAWAAMVLLCWTSIRAIRPVRGVRQTVAPGEGVKLPG
jgi:apolipoprotein N-acyltransferase